ncbi:MAG: hypothetical protein ACRBFS_06270 [Aureispira sp.]
MHRFTAFLVLLIDQVRLLLLVILTSIHNDQQELTSLTFKLFEQGGLSIKIVNKGQAFNPFEEQLFGNGRFFVNAFKVATLGWHLVHKYMDIYTYHRAIMYNIIYMKKEQV